MKKILLYLFTFAALQVVMAFFLDVVLKLFWPSISSSSTTSLLIISIISDLAVVALFLGLKWCPVSRNYVRTKPWMTLFWTAMLGLGIVFPLSWLEEFIPEAWRMDLNGVELMQMLQTTEGYFALCMLAPLAEEIVFRGALIRAIRSFCEQRGWAHPAMWAVIASTVCFAVIHLNPAQIPHALIVGLILGWLFVKTGSIVPGCIVHWINNSMAYVIVKCFPWLPMDASVNDIFNHNTMAIAQALVCSLLIALPSAYQLYKSKN